MVAKGINHEEAYEAWTNWCDYFYEQGTWGGYDDENTGYCAFERFMGANIFRSDIALFDETIRKVKLLNSTHWRTVMKVVEINANK